MSRKTKRRAPVEIPPPAEVADAAQPRGAPHVSPTTNLVVEALRQNRSEGGLEHAKAELIAALAGCLRYSIELDGLAGTLARLADAAVVLERGFKNAGPSTGSRVY